MLKDWKFIKLFKKRLIIKILVSLNKIKMNKNNKKEYIRQFNKNRFKWKIKMNN